jgi:hypothetical protein
MRSLHFALLAFAAHSAYSSLLAFAYELLEFAAHSALLMFAAHCALLHILCLWC